MLSGMRAIYRNLKSESAKKRFIGYVKKVKEKLEAMDDSDKLYNEGKEVFK